MRRDKRSQAASRVQQVLSESEESSDNDGDVDDDNGVGDNERQKETGYICNTKTNKKPGFKDVTQLKGNNREVVMPQE